MWFLKLTLTLAGIYAAVVAVAYALQTRLIFPAGLAAVGPDLPPGARNVELATEEGERAVLVRLPAGGRPPNPGRSCWASAAMAGTPARLP